MNDQRQYYEALIQESLDDALACGATAAEASLSEDKGFSVSSRQAALEQIEYHQERSFSITVYQGLKTASVSSTDLSKKALTKVIRKALSIVQYADEVPYAALPDPALLAYHYPNINSCYEWAITPLQAADLAIECEAIARQQDSRITDSEGATLATVISLYVQGNTHGFIGSFATSQHSLSCQVVAKEGGDMQRDSEYTIARKPEDLVPIDIIAQKAAEKTIKRLTPRQIKTTHAPIIFHATEAKGLLRSFVNALSGAALYRKNSFLLDSLGKAIFPAHVSIYQEPHLGNAMGSRPFDYEGVLTADRHYVQEGVLQSYVLGSYAARRLGMTSTGNAGGVFNLSITHSEMSLEEMLAQMQCGLLVTELLGQGVRMMTGDYSRGAFGYWVEHGEIQYPVDEITVAGNLKDMFKNIVAVANDVDRRGNMRTGSIWIEGMTIAGQ